MNRWLLALYPAGWRVRYGDEFALLLEERPLGPFDVIDVMLAAFDAHLHLRGAATSAGEPKAGRISQRVGGSAAVVGGLLWLAGVLGSILAGEGFGITGFLLIGAGSFGILVGLAGLSGFQSRVHPRAAWLAFAAPSLGLVVLLAGIVGLGTLPATAVIGGVSLWLIFIIGFLGVALGSILFSVINWSTRTLPREGLVLLSAGALTGIASAMGLLPDIADKLGLVLFPVGWILLGWQARKLPTPRRAVGAIV